MPCVFKSYRRGMHGQRPLLRFQWHFGTMTSAWRPRRLRLLVEYTALLQPE